VLSVFRSRAVRGIIIDVRGIVQGQFAGSSSTFEGLQVRSTPTRLLSLHSRSR
jgi:hypothetical protein